MDFKQYNYESAKWRLNGVGNVDLSAYGPSTTLEQTDTYFKTHNGDRLKIRDELNRVYAIRYARPDTESGKESHYDFYEIGDYGSFMNTFGPGLDKELEIVKSRELFEIDNIRIHRDTVRDLGVFVEIEIVIKSETEAERAPQQLEEMIDTLALNQFPTVSCGYRELMIKRDDQKKDYVYYFNSDKIYWVVNQDIPNTSIKANDQIPCLFINALNQILRIDPTIANDNLKYTMFRRAAGEAYSVYVQVLLMHDDQLYRLDGSTVDFKSLGRSDTFVDKKYLAPITHI